VGGGGGGWGGGGGGGGGGGWGGGCVLGGGGGENSTEKFRNDTPEGRGLGAAFEASKKKKGYPSIRRSVRKPEIDAREKTLRKK